MSTRKMELRPKKPVEYNESARAGRAMRAIHVSQENNALPGKRNRRVVTVDERRPTNRKPLIDPVFPQQSSKPSTSSKKVSQPAPRIDIHQKNICQNSHRSCVIRQCLVHTIYRITQKQWHIDIRNFCVIRNIIRTRSVANGELAYNANSMATLPALYLCV